MKVQTQTEEVRRLRRTNLELIFSDHNAYCLPPCQNKCPSHIDIPGFLKANAEAELARVDPDLQADDPVPVACSAGSARRRARSTAGATRSTRRSRSATATATPATRSSRRCSTRASIRRSRSSARPQSGRRAAVIGSGPAGMAAAYYLLLAGHDVTVFERDPAPGGMLRYGIPQYRLPKVEVLEAEYESVTRLGGKIVCNAGLGPRLHARRPARTRASTRSSSRSAATTRTSSGIPGEDADGVLDGLEYLRTATLGLPYPGHAGKRVVVIGGGFTSMDCSRTSIRQGAAEVTLVYRRDMKDMPASNEVHEAIEEGVTAIFQAGPIRVITDKNGQGHRASSSSGWSSARPTPPAAAGRSRPPGTEFTIPCDRVLLAIGQGPDLDLDRARLRRPEATKQRRLKADAVTFETDRPGVFGTGDVRIGAATVVQAIAEGRRVGVRRRRVPQGPRPRPRSGPARRSPSRSPSSSRSCRSRARSRSRATASRRWRPRSATRATSSTRSRTRRPRPSPSRPAASSAPARRSASATCAASMGGSVFDVGLGLRRPCGGATR